MQWSQHGKEEAISGEGHEATNAHLLKNYENFEHKTFPDGHIEFRYLKSHTSYIKYLPTRCVSLFSLCFHFKNIVILTTP